ncbi:MAG: NAD(P)H-hydrate dehydratase [Candidatus Thioglobus sp.]|nr:MAG: NAD(P)H-hydrate dehydratase [Candidatus Thioglobus sp.]
MRNLTNALYSVAQIRAIEASARKFLKSDKSLMELAGQEAYSCLRQCWPSVSRVVVLCGGGNNGGDGFVLARLAQNAGLSVCLVLAAKPSTSEAEEALNKALAAGVVASSFSEAALVEADLIVDALLGIGFSGKVREPFRTIMLSVNKQVKPVFSLDVPSGLDADSGRISQVAITADVTMSFIGLKRGLFMSKARDVAGDIVFKPLIAGHLSVHDDFWATCLSDQWIENVRPTRHNSFHKGDAGHVGVVGGFRGMPGAVALSGLAALRSGAGRVTVGCFPDNAESVAAMSPELMVKPLMTDDDVHQLLESVDVAVIGPGLGLTDWSKKIFHHSIQTTVPKVVDADALTLLEANRQVLTDAVLTPHPGEAARMLGINVGCLEGDRPSALEALLAKFNSIAVLKGAGTLIGRANGEQLICDRGNPGMATAGMGDVLSGMIGGLMSQGLPAFEAAGAGVWLHASAGDLIAKNAGAVGMLASDLIRQVPYLSSRLR